MRLMLTRPELGFHYSDMRCAARFYGGHRGSWIRKNSGSSGFGLCLLQLAGEKTSIGAVDVGRQVVAVLLPVREALVEEELLAKVANEELKQKEEIGSARLLDMRGELCIEYELAEQSFCPGAFVAPGAMREMLEVGGE